MVVQVKQEDLMVDEVVTRFILQIGDFEEVVQVEVTLMEDIQAGDRDYPI